MLSPEERTEIGEEIATNPRAGIIIPWSEGAPKDPRLAGDTWIKYHRTFDFGDRQFRISYVWSTTRDIVLDLRVKAWRSGGVGKWTQVPLP